MIDVGFRETSEMMAVINQTKQEINEVQINIFKRIYLPIHGLTWDFAMTTMAVRDGDERGMMAVINQTKQEINEVHTNQYI